MKAQRKSEKKTKPKSLQRKQIPKKHQINRFFDNVDLCLPSNQKGIFGDMAQLERRVTRSQQGSRASNRKPETDLILTNLRVSLENWADERLRSGLKQKPNISSYNILHVIGKGGFGKVWKVEQKKTGSLFAMKEMSKAVILTKKSMDSVTNQRQLLVQIKHKFIVNMRQAFQDRENLYLVMDLMTGGDLRYHICKKHKFTEQQTRFFAACIFSGLEYLHQNKIIHRDLKPQNLVLDGKGYIHLTDLGIAKRLRAENSSDTSGTPGYMAPEVMCRRNHSFEVDYYALGVILYQLMMGKRPYAGKSRKQIRQQILAKQTVIKKSDIPEGWSIEVADFINKLIQRQPMMRIGWGGAHQVKSHSWLKNFPWQLLEREQIQSPFKNFSRYNAGQVRYQPTKQDEQLSNLIKQNKILLRNSTVQRLFQGYSFYEQQSELENQTTSSELHRNKRSSDKTLEVK